MPQTHGCWISLLPKALGRVKEEKKAATLKSLPAQLILCMNFPPTGKHTKGMLDLHVCGFGCKEDRCYTSAQVLSDTKCYSGEGFGGFAYEQKMSRKHQVNEA